MALKTLTIPAPIPGRYPNARMPDGRPYTVVRAYTWYFTDPAAFLTLTSTVTVGPIRATVTVTPSRLTFTPGNGSAAVSCGGPGVAWSSRYGPWARSPVGCDYRYQRTSVGYPHNEEVTATYGIVWRITWTTNVGAAGTLPDLTTTAISRFVVAELQTVVVGH